MLLFILTVALIANTREHFNTSHVTVYHAPCSIFPKSFSYFNTSHVTVYHGNVQQNLAQQRNFNTSHVTVYRGVPAFTIFLPKFQYISCYCLSGRSPNINWLQIISIHLMLLFIGLFIYILLWRHKISIHLMLLFIFKDLDTSSVVQWFQYISCYCLSCQNRTSCNHSIISIHLMLLFIDAFKLFIILNAKISIHLMLLFIYPNAPATGATYYFNTSHVTVYPAGGNSIFTGCVISIHLMLLFIGAWQKRRLRQNDFNTSHVTVYLGPIFVFSCFAVFQYISCYCLSPLDYSSVINAISFQYISCYCLSNELTPFYIFLRI